MSIISYSLRKTTRRRRQLRQPKDNSSRGYLSKLIGRLKLPDKNKNNNKPSSRDSSRRDFWKDLLRKTG